MTDADEALLWAREQLANTWREDGAPTKAVAAALAGEFDDVLGLAAHDYRAGSAASAARIKELEARVEAFEWALTPSGDTKAAYLGEFKQDVGRKKIVIEWTTVKEIMNKIRSRALLKESDQ